ncbi:MAG: hypothetical protein IIB19_06655, partial [Chloroflexi bacterium]|nr:hypothetical protein [Chloroflexota bacterium]
MLLETRLPNQLHRGKVRDTASLVSAVEDELRKQGAYGYARQVPENTANEIAETAHKGQKRWDGTPYIWHPRRVAGVVRDTVEHAETVALLHDVIEDTKVGEWDLRQAGIHDVAIEAVMVLTRKRNQSYDEYIFQVSRCPLS